MLTLQKLPLQTTSPSFLKALLVLVAAALLNLPAVAQKTQVTYLTSDIPLVGTFQDTNLVNPWGMADSPSGPWWVSDNGTGLSTLYDGSGKPQALVVTIPRGSGSGNGLPTGQVFNGTGQFKISGSSAVFIFVTQDGTISGWSSGTSATIAVNNSSSGAVYKGVTLSSAGGNNYLYVANFHNGTVDVFDQNFAPFSFGAGSFTDSTVPAGFAPFNVANVGNGHLAVTYAKQDANKQNDVPGVGNGYITIYDTSGNIVSRLAHTLYNNSPWAVVVAPNGFGGFGGDYLVSMFGGGTIEAFTPAGNFVGLFFSLANVPLTVDGIWGLGFGNGAIGGSGPKTTLYFTAGAFNQAHGIFGSMIPKSGPDNDVQVEVIKQW
jgi:uncharacterized protein (TIGR03118 family)